MVETSNIYKVIEEIIYSVRAYFCERDAYIRYRIYVWLLRDYPKQYEQMIGFFLKKKLFSNTCFQE